MGQAFLAGGLSGYLGCHELPDGMAMNVFLVNFFFNVSSKKMSDSEAWRQATKATDHEDIWQVRYFHGIGAEERLERA